MWGHDVLIYPNKCDDDRSVKDMLVFNGVKAVFIGLPLLTVVAFRQRSRIAAIRRQYMKPE